MNRVLYVDDDLRYCKLLERYTKDRLLINYRISKDNLIELIGRYQYDIVVIDIRSGIEEEYNCIEMMSYIYLGPIIVISENLDYIDKIKCLKLGAVDCLKKPLNLETFVYKVNSLVKISSNEIKEVYGEYELYYARDELYRNGERIRLSKHPYRILVCLLRNMNCPVSREQLFLSVWGREYDFSSRLIDTNMSTIRTKLKDENIKTIRGSGYIYSYENY